MAARRMRRVAIVSAVIAGALVAAVGGAHFYYSARLENFAASISDDCWADRKCASAALVREADELIAGLPQAPWASADLRLRGAMLALYYGNDVHARRIADLYSDYAEGWAGDEKWNHLLHSYAAVCGRLGDMDQALKWLDSFSGQDRGRLLGLSAMASIKRGRTMGRIFEAIGGLTDPEAKFYAWWFTAQGFAELGRHDEARDILSRLDNPVDRAYVLDQMAKVARNMGNATEADRYWAEAFDLVRSVLDQSGTIFLTKMFGVERVVQNQTNYGSASGAEAMALSLEGDDLQEVIAYLVSVHLRVGDADRTRFWIEKMEWPNERNYFYLDLVISLADEARQTEAEALLDWLASEMASHPEDRDPVMGLADIAQTYAAIGSEKFTDRAAVLLEIIDRDHGHPEEDYVLGHLSFAYEVVGDRAKALELIGRIKDDFEKSMALMNILYPLIESGKIDEVAEIIATYWRVSSSDMPPLWGLFLGTMLGDPSAAVRDLFSQNRYGYDRFGVSNLDHLVEHPEFYDGARLLLPALRDRGIRSPGLLHPFARNAMVSGNLQLAYASLAESEMLMRARYWETPLLSPLTFSAVRAAGVLRLLHPYDTPGVPVTLGSVR